MADDYRNKDEPPFCHRTDKYSFLNFKIGCLETQRSEYDMETRHSEYDVLNAYSRRFFFIIYWYRSLNHSQRLNLLWLNTKGTESEQMRSG